jgi:hypothetical protein
LDNHIQSARTCRGWEAYTALLPLHQRSTPGPLKRDLKSWEATKEVKSDNGVMGNLKRWHKDLYEQVVKKEIDMDKALEVANSRKASPSDKKNRKPIKNVANIAVSVSETDTVSVTEKKLNTPPPVDEFLNHCKDLLKEKYLPLEFALKAKYKSWIEANWKDGNNKPIKNWKTKIANVIPFLKPMQITNDQLQAPKW